MNKLILALAVLTLTLTSNSAYSEEAEAVLLDAPNDYVISLLKLCKDYSIDDEVPEKDMTKYLLACINEELAESFYKAIKVLPTEEKET
jgi:hypothetical protein